MPDGMGSTDDPSVLARQSAHEERPEDALRRIAREAVWLRQELERVKADRRAWRIAAFGSLAASLVVALGLTTSGVCS